MLLEKLNCLIFKVKLDYVDWIFFLKKLNIQKLYEKYDNWNFSAY